MGRLQFFILTIAFCFITAAAYSAPDSGAALQQPKSIQNIIDSEKNRAARDKLVEIVGRIDETYANLYENLNSGKKLVIFIDPAHGKLPNGQWQGGDATRRTSCTGLPEEYYSILLSRKIYGLLSKNKFIEVKSTDDFMEVLKGASDTYKDIPFPRTVELADKAGAFIIISEHLNNISVVYKADGRVNLPGIHVTRNGYDWKVLQYVRDTYSGFLTLYNKVDASGFSRSYAIKLKNMLESRGLQPNSWNFGAVGDTRYSYFIDFPMSVIYESGFISNPEEEKKLKDVEYIEKIVGSQYQALLETINDIFAVDLSGDTVKKTGTPSADRIELLKLARLAIYYIQAVDSGKAIQIIREMERKYSGTKYGEYTYFFSNIKKNLVLSSQYYSMASKYKRQKKSKLARRYYSLARRYIMRAPIFAKMHARYHAEMRSAGLTGSPIKASTIEIMPSKKSSGMTFIAKAPLRRSIILPIEQNQSLEKAIQLALAPDEETLKKLVKSFNTAKNYMKIKTYEYSKKKKKRIARWVETSRRVKFGTGIYIVKLDNNYNVTGARYVYSVTLNPGEYQNQQYLKNSYFAHDHKERSL